MKIAMLPLRPPADSEGWLSFVPYRILLELDNEYPGVVFISALSCGTMLQEQLDYVQDESVVDVVQKCIHLVDIHMKQIALIEKEAAKNHGHSIH